MTQALVVGVLLIVANVLGIGVGYILGKCSNGYPSKKDGVENER